MRDASRKQAIGVAVVLVLCAVPNVAIADGGRVQRNDVIGGRRVTVLTATTTLRVGNIDVSVLVQDAQTGEVIRNVEARVELRSETDSNRHEGAIAADLSHEHSKTD